MDTAVALAGSRPVAVTSRQHAATTASEVAAEVGQADAEPSGQIPARQAVAPSSDRASLKVQVHALSSASTVKSWDTSRVIAAVADKVASVKVKPALATGGSTDPSHAPYSNFKHRVSAVSTAPGQEVIEEEGEVAEASGYTANCISSANVNGPAKQSALHQSRKLLAVPGVINGLDFPCLLVDCGSPVTLIRADLWEQVRLPQNKLLIEEEKFQGVTRDGLRVFGLAYLKLQFGSMHIEHPVVVVDKIAHKFILGNDFLVQHKCDILNSDGSIVFGNKSVPYTLFRSTINLICPVICPSRTEIGPYEEAIIPGLLDSYRNYDPDQTLLLEPRKTELMQPLIAARVVVNFTSAIVPILVSNISPELVTIPKGKVLADETALKTRRIDLQELSTPPGCVASVSTSDVGSAAPPDPVAEAMKNADKALVSEQRVLLERLLRKHATVFSAGPTDIGRTSLIYHRIDIGDSGPVRQPMRRITSRTHTCTKGRNRQAAESRRSGPFDISLYQPNYPR